MLQHDVLQAGGSYCTVADLLIQLNGRAHRIQDTTKDSPPTFVDLTADELFF